MVRVTFEQLTPGINASDIALSIRKVVEDEGYGDYLLDVMGHGIGLHPLEPPTLTSQNDTPLLPGMVLCIESGLYHADIGGVRLGETIVIQKEGTYLRLNQIPLDTV